MKMQHYFLLLPLLLVACARTPMPAANNADLSLAQNTSDSGVTSCEPLRPSDRQRILDLADPKNFEHTHYHKGPRDGQKIEEEADCSSFVHEIYRRANLPYGYRSSRDLKNAPEFEVIGPDEAAPGDLIVFSGHVGIIAEDGTLISATRTHKRHKDQSAITKMQLKNFHRLRFALRYRCGTESLAQK